MNETVITVIGNVVDEPTYRAVDSGVGVASFRVASSGRRYDRAAGKWIDGEALFLRVSCWRVLAEHVHRCVHKGDPVVVAGRLTSHTWEVDGQRRSENELEARAVGFDLARGVADFTRVPRARTSPPTGSGTDGDPAVGSGQGGSEVPGAPTGAVRAA